MANPFTNPEPDQMPFGRKNYLWLLIGVVAITFGFILMALDGNFKDATQFSISLHVSPIIIIVGYAVVAYAIMINPGKASQESQSQG